MSKDDLNSKVLTNEKNQSSSVLEITSEDLQEKLHEKSGKPIMIFDIGNKQRYQDEHIPGSKFVVCDQQTINNLLPKLPKNVDIVLVAEDENYAKQMAQRAKERGGLRTKYLKGGISAWNGERTERQDPKKI